VIEMVCRIGRAARSAQEFGEHLVDQPQRHRRINAGRLPSAAQQVSECEPSFGHLHRDCHSL
jgi:hypothetical protein